MNDNNKMLERVLLMMKYDSSKTLTENSDAVRNEFSQLLSELRGRPRGSLNKATIAKQNVAKQNAATAAVKVPAITQQAASAYKQQFTAQNPGMKPSPQQLKAFKQNGNQVPTGGLTGGVPISKNIKTSGTAPGTVNVQAPATSLVTVKPATGAKANQKVSTKNLSILSKFKGNVKKYPWRYAFGLGLTGGAALWYFLRDNTEVSPCLLNSLSEEEMVGLEGAGTTGTITRAQVGNRLADLNGGLIFSLDNTGVTTGNGKYKGTYSCEGDAIKISIGGSEFTIGSTGTVDKGTSGGGGGGSRYKQCAETFPIAMYCKNSTIARVQGCVGVKQDGAFGPKTSAALVAKGADGSSITQATIDKVCGGGQSNKQSAPFSDAEEDDAGGGNTMTVKSSGPLATDDADEA